MKVELRELQTIPVEVSKLTEVARAAADELDANLDSLSLVIVDEARICQLNCQLLGRSGPTDVIAFEAEQDAEGRSGEIIVSVQTAQRQASQYGHNLTQELCLLVVHGLLHVTGYEDDTAGGRAEMERLQTQLAAQLCP